MGILVSLTSNSADQLAAATTFVCSDSIFLPRRYKQQQQQQHNTCSIQMTGRRHNNFFLQQRAMRMSRRAQSKLWNSAQIDHDNNSDNAAFSDGVFVDLGTIAPFIDDITFVDMDSEPPSTIHASTHLSGKALNTTIEEWRSNHWIVLIDDESPIRLAIGDYLHSMGYSVITACDGPMTFLEMILWSCSWSLLSMNTLEEREEEVDNIRQSPPPWIESHNDDNYQPWRLPNCIISDIRMPGGIDGVQLLEILRRCSPIDNTDNMAEDGRLEKKEKRRGRPKKVESISDGYYDDKDEFDLLDAIVDGKSNVQLDKIITPVDQAVQYFDAIRELLAYFNDQENSGQLADLNAMNYPNSLEQIPVILLTAKAMVSDRIQGYKAGANGYLPKPFRPEELLAMVDNLMRRQERERQHFTHTQSLSVGNDDKVGIEELTPEEAKAIARELAEIKSLIKERLGQQDSERTIQERQKLQSLLAEANWLLRTGERRKRVLTKDHIRSVLLFEFGIELPRNNVSWDDAMNVLEEQRTKHPDQLKKLLLSLEVEHE